ncbi:MAG TPA: peptidylprolyl isomerase [Verrucomicrobiae bacterium]|jgi:peptidyl-prolyl cis-trans isomerase SurA|nr:peptidylprolyl isomerase [Verrucomicrobiae bacterium]
MKPVKWLLFLIVFTSLGVPAFTQTKSAVVEEIVARVNNEIITREDLDKARTSLETDVREACTNCSDEQVRTQVEAKNKDLLRDLIDQSLLTQRAKDDGINVDADVIKRLDAIRLQNKLPDMDALEKAIRDSGQDFEDFKSQLRDQLLTQEIIRKEVGSKIIISHEDAVKYYNEHKSEFVRPETVVLREIFVSTEGKSATEIPDLRKKADNLRIRVLNNGEDFGEMAKHYSDSTTGKQGGELGVFQRTQLDPKIAEKVFALNRNQMTDVMETKTGFEILQVVERYDAGEQTLEKVEPEITNKLYEQKMEPALRDYLKTLREDSYLQIKPGYTDTAAVKTEPIEEVAAAPEKDDSKSKGGKRLGIFPKKKSGT